MGYFLPCIYILLAEKNKEIIFQQDIVHMQGAALVAVRSEKNKNVFKLAYI